MPLDAKGNPQDEPTVLAGQDTLPPGGELPSGESAPEPSTSPEVFTKEQVDKLLNERHSKLDSRIAELERLTTKSTRAMEQANQRTKEAEEALARSLKEQEEKELAEIQDRPDELSLYRAKQRVREEGRKNEQTKKELEASKAEHEEALAEVLTFKLNQVAQAIAAKYEGVDAGLLIQLTDKTPEKMELLASQLGKAKAKTPMTPRPDSGLSSGGAGKLTAEQIEKMSAEDYAQHPSVKARFK